MLYLRKIKKILQMYCNFEINAKVANVTTAENAEDVIKKRAVKKVNFL